MSAAPVAAEELLHPTVDAAIAAALRVEHEARRALAMSTVAAARREVSPHAPADAHRPLRIVYLVADTTATEETRTLLQLANGQCALGHSVVVLSHFPLPEWFALRAEYRQIAFGAELAEAVPDCDVVVTGRWDQIVAAAALAMAPVVHLELGGAHLTDGLDVPERDWAARSLAAADDTLAATPAVAAALLARYGVHAALLAPAGVPGGAIAVETTAGEAPPAASPLGELNARCTAAAASWQAPAGDLGWVFDLSGLTFETSAPERTLARRLARTSARFVAVPVSSPAAAGLRIVRWRTVGHRPDGTGTAQIYLPARAETPAGDLPYASALAHWQHGDLTAAVVELARLFGESDEARRATVGRWLLLALVELGREGEAAELASSMVATWPHHPDFHCLQAIVALRRGRALDREGFVRLIAHLGVASFADEWFDDCVEIARRQLSGSGATSDAGTVLLRGPRPSALLEGNDPYFVQQLSVSNAFSGRTRLEVFTQLLAGKRVLHVGYADWPITDPRQNLHVQLDGVCAALDGFDPHDDAASVIGSLVSGRLFSSWGQVRDDYDVVLVPEVLEHVAEVETFFAALDRVSFRTIVLTVPDLYQCVPRHFGYDAASGVFTEVVHPDHNAWYSPYTFYNVVTKHTNWKVEGLWFFNGMSLLMVATKPA